MLNFLRYAPNTRLLITVREPVQSCESWLRSDFAENNYEKCTHKILGMLFGIDKIPFRIRKSVGVRLEDLKARPNATLKALSSWLGVTNSPTLYEMTAQGRKWWGDPSSPDYSKDKAMPPFGDSMTKRPVGTIFNKIDQFVLETLFYPFSVRFGYRTADPELFKKDLKKVRPLLDDMFGFEKTIAERSDTDYGQFRRSGLHHLLHAGMIDRWSVLNELGDYPNMLEPLSIA